MPQVFSPGTNSLARVTCVSVPVVILGALWWIGAINRSDYMTGVGEARQQPVPFSHQHHVVENGIDCRYCHWSVEQSPFANVPGAEICIQCHVQVWDRAPMLEPVRQAYISGQPLKWVRVTDLPDHVYFDHSIHVRQGVGCEECHGRVDRMPMTWLAHPLQMEWCLGCHRDPYPHLRPRDQVFDMDWQYEGDREQLGRQLAKEYGIHVEHLDECNVCHR